MHNTHTHTHECTHTHAYAHTHNTHTHTHTTHNDTHTHQTHTHTFTHSHTHCLQTPTHADTIDTCSAETCPPSQPWLVHHVCRQYQWQRMGTRKGRGWRSRHRRHASRWRFPAWLQTWATACTMSSCPTSSALKLGMFTAGWCFLLSVLCTLHCPNGQPYEIVGSLSPRIAGCSRFALLSRKLNVHGFFACFLCCNGFCNCVHTCTGYWAFGCLLHLMLKANGDPSVLNCPQTDTGLPPHPSQESLGCSTIIEEREVSWSRQHPSRTGPSRWTGCNYRSHDNLHHFCCSQQLKNRK